MKQAVVVKPNFLWPLHNKHLTCAALALAATEKVLVLPLTCPHIAGVGVPGPRWILLSLPSAAHRV